jgi:hypothetical protein
MKLTKAQKDEEIGVEWQAYAHCMTSGDLSAEPGFKYIQIPATERCVTMPGTKCHSGSPVDANLAVQFIRNFFKYYKIYKRDYQQNLESIKTNQNFAELLDFHEKTHEKTTRLHDSLVDLTYGMTLEKDMILKIISQPKCEGVRFYLCARKAIQDNQMHLSLVTVGVDKDGYDLHYNKKSTVKANQIARGVQDLNTQSLTGEYFTPPPPTSTSQLFEETSTQTSDDAKKAAAAKSFQDRFVLLNLAKKLP